MARMPIGERRDRLVAAAIEVIAEGGVAAATTRAIAARADMPLASFHYAFESHTALMTEAIRRIQNDDATSIATMLNPEHRSLVDTVEEGLCHYLDGLVARPERHQAEMELNFWAMRQDGHADLAAASVESALEAIMPLIDAWARGAEKDVDRKAVAEHLLILTNGLETQFYFTRDADLVRRTIPALASGFADYEK